MNWDEDKAPSFKFGFQLGATDADSEVVADTVAAQTPAVPELAGEELTPDEVQQAVDAADVRALCWSSTSAPGWSVCVGGARGRAGSTCTRAAASEPSGS
jgi:hypothetical protein